MHLEGDHVVSHHRAVQGEHETELAEHGGVMGSQRGRVVVGRGGHVEARHALAVEVHEETVQVLHAHVHHLVVVEVRDVEHLAHVQHLLRRRADVRRETLRPLRVVETEVVPALLGEVVRAGHLPHGVVDLEGDVRREGRRRDGRRRHLRERVHVEAQLALVDGHAVASRLRPAVSRRVETHEREDAVQQAVVLVDERLALLQVGLLLDHGSLRAAALEQLVLDLLGIAVSAHRDGDQVAVAVAADDVHVHHVGGRLAGHLARVDGHLTALDLRGRAHDDSRRGVERQTHGERGRHVEAHVLVVRGVGLGELDVLVALQRAVVREVGDVRLDAIDVHHDVVDDPRLVAVRGRQVREAVHVVGLVVRQVHHLLLRHHPPLQARNGQQRRPLLLLAVTRQQREALQVVRQRVVVVLHRHRGNPLAAVILEADVDGARHGLRVLTDAVAVVAIERPGHVHRVHVLASVLGVERAVVGGVAQGTDDGIEGAVVARAGVDSEETDRDGVGTLLQVLHSRRVGSGDGLVRQRDDSVHQLVVRADSRGRSRDGGGGVDVVAEHLVTVHVHHHTVAVGDREGEAAAVRQRRHGEGLLVQLDVVAGGGVLTVLALRPARDRAIVPVGGHAAHHVVPAALLGKRTVHADVQRRGERQVLVIGVAAEHGLALVVAEDRVDIQVGVAVPVVIRVIREIDLVARMHSADTCRPRRLRLLRRARAHIDHRLVGGEIDHLEHLLHDVAHAVHTLHLHHGGVAGNDGDGEHRLDVVQAVARHRVARLLLRLRRHAGNRARVAVKHPREARWTASSCRRRAWTRWCSGSPR